MTTELRPSRSARPQGEQAPETKQGSYANNSAEHVNFNEIFRRDQGRRLGTDGGWVSGNLGRPAKTRADGPAADDTKLGLRGSAKKNSGTPASKATTPGEHAGQTQTDGARTDVAATPIHKSRSSLNSAFEGIPKEKPEPLKLREERAELDPLMRVLSGSLGTFTQPLSSGPAGSTPVAAMTLDTIATELVRRFSFSGRGSNGTVRLEFGGGALAGGSLLISCEGNALSVSLDAPGDAQAALLGEKIRQRLLARGLEVAEFEVNG